MAPRPRCRRAGSRRFPGAGALSGALTIAECSRQALGIWDFDDVIYPGLPGDLKVLALMCHLLGTEHYAPNGGDERLLTAARALTARTR